MEYTTPETIPQYSECEPLIKGLGYGIVEFAVFKRQASWQVKIVINGPNGIGIADCTRVHRAILPRLEALLSSTEIYIEVTSPGLDRLIKNAFEFQLFIGKEVRIWNTDISDWMAGKILGSDTQSLRLEVTDGEMIVPYDKIAKAKLYNS